MEIQLYKWMYQKLILNINDMSDIPVNGLKKIITKIAIQSMY